MTSAERGQGSADPLQVEFPNRDASHDVGDDVYEKSGRSADVTAASRPKPRGTYGGVGEGGDFPAQSTKESLSNASNAKTLFQGVDNLGAAAWGPDSGAFLGGWRQPGSTHVPSPPPGLKGASHWPQRSISDEQARSSDVSKAPCQLGCPDYPEGPSRAPQAWAGKERPPRVSDTRTVGWAQPSANCGDSTRAAVTAADVSAPGLPCEILADCVPPSEQLAFTATRGGTVQGGSSEGGGGEEEKQTGEKRKAEQIDVEGLLRELAPPQVIYAKPEFSGGVTSSLEHAVREMRCPSSKASGVQNGVSASGGGDDEWWATDGIPPQSGRFKKPRPLALNIPLSLPLTSPHVTTPSLHETFRPVPQTLTGVTCGPCPATSDQPPLNPLFNHSPDPNLDLTALVMDHINGLLDQQAKKLYQADATLPDSPSISSGELFQQHSQLRAALDFLTSITTRDKPEGSRGLGPALPAVSAASKHSPVDMIGDSPKHSGDSAPAPFLPTELGRQKPGPVQFPAAGNTALGFWEPVVASGGRRTPGESTRGTQPGLAGCRFAGP